jgi:flavin-dependent dehydrogenase
VKVDWKSEILVIGGGPAGCTVARRLACLGHDVHLIEQHKFPRLHVGESLSPGILALLDTLGARDRIESAPFLRPQKAIVHWRDETTYVKWQPGEPGFQVDRGEFDLLLLELALESGVTVSQPAQAFRPVRDGATGWIIPFQQAGRLCYGKARFLVDASGRQSIMSSKRQRTSPPTIALYGYWQDTGLRGTETRVEAGTRNWYWGAPLPGAILNASVFLDPTQCKIPKANDLESFYRRLLSESILLRQCLNGKLTCGVTACNASSSHDAEPIGESFIKVGEACFAIDPLSSQGVQAAMLSAVQASIVCHTILTAPLMAPTAIEFYRERQAETMDRHRHWAAGYYAEQQSFRSDEFWASRALQTATSSPRAQRPLSIRAPADQCPIQVSKDVAVIETAVIDGDTIRLSPAISHPELARPVAFLDNIPVAPLLRTIVSGQTFGHTLEKWSGSISTANGLRILNWMWSRKIIVSIGSPIGSRERE